MSVWDIIAIGIALSMDACALTIANCTVCKKGLSLKKQWAMPISFALFQGVMPIIGYFIGSLFAKYLESIGGFLVAGVFYALSIKIVIDIIKDMKKDKNKEECPVKDLSFGMIIVQAVATSVDALLIGVSFSLNLSFSIFGAVGIIALTTFILVSIAMILGKYLGSVLGKYAEWAGAIILFALATKELVFAIMGL